MAEWDKPCLAVLGGPTASGKTGLSVALARAFGGEIGNADSMQIYQGLDVGTAKVTAAEAQGVPHHLVGFLAPEKAFSVADYVEAAGRCIGEIAGRGRLPFVVGGTGLYIESLLEGVRFAPQKTDPALRAALALRADREGPEALHAELRRIDPAYAAAVHPHNKGRVLRALELYYTSGVTMTQQREASRPAQRPYNALVLCLDWPRGQLYERIDRRVDQMLERGLLAEAELVWKNRESYKTAAQAIGYKEFFPYFEGAAPLEACAAKLKQASRNYAKRQLTWFRRMEGVVWLDGSAPGVQQAAEQAIRGRFAL